MAEHYLGEIRMFAGSYAPGGRALCDGRSLSVAENRALFDLLGTTYGGDGLETFCLPDLRGRVPVHHGQATEGAFQIGDQTRASTPPLVESSAEPPAGSGEAPVARVTPYAFLTYVIALDGAPPDQDDPDLTAEPLLGEVRILPFGFAPSGWLPCEGWMLDVTSNPALFSVIGRQYGGNGYSTFCLPDLRGRVARHPPAVETVDGSAPGDGSGLPSPGRVELGFFIAHQGYYPAREVY